MPSRNSDLRDKDVSTTIQLKKRLVQNGYFKISRPGLPKAVPPLLSEKATANGLCKRQNIYSSTISKDSEAFESLDGKYRMVEAPVFLLITLLNRPIFGTASASPPTTFSEITLRSCSNTFRTTRGDVPLATAMDLTRSAPALDDAGTARSPLPSVCFEATFNPLMLEAADEFFGRRSGGRCQA